jgi:hypothetical protein
MYPLQEYQKEDGRDFPGYISDYQPMVEHFGTVAVQVDDHDYQGDTRVLYADTGKGFGYLQFGWGSCSGCDSLQACDSYQDVAELMARLEAGIKWMPRDEMFRYFSEHDWEGDYSWHQDEQKEFIRQVLEYFGTKGE